MIITSIPADQVYIVCGFTDMRRSIDGLTILIQQTYRQNPFSRSLYLFCGRRNDRIKGIYWEGDGFVLLYKRLERGHFIWPRNASEVRQLTNQQLRWLMEGLSIEQPKAIKEMPPYQLT